MVIKKLGFSFVFNLLLLALTNAAQVTSNSNDGEGSLRQVMADAEGGDTITFSNSFTITLVSPITINKDIVIDGGDKVTLSGGEETTIFKITSGNVEIKNITLRDGLSQGGKGGGPSRFRSHGAGGGGAGLGGAIAIRNGNVLLDGVSFINNKAIGGNGGSANKMEHVLDEAPNSPLYKDMSGYGGSSVLGSGASRTVWGNRSSGKNGGLGGGGGGSINYDNGAKGGNGGFGGGGGGGDAGGFRRSSRGLGGLGGSFAGSGGNGAGGNNDTMNYLAGGGGGGAGLGGAVYIHDGILTARDCEFERNSAVGGVGGTGATKGTDGQGVGGAIFANTDAEINVNSLTFKNNFSSLSENISDDIFINKKPAQSFDSNQTFGVFSVETGITTNEDVAVNLNVAVELIKNVLPSTNGELAGIVFESLTNGKMVLNSVTIGSGTLLRLIDFESLSYSPTAHFPVVYPSTDYGLWKISSIYRRRHSEGYVYHYPVNDNELRIEVKSTNDSPTIKNASISMNEDTVIVIPSSKFDSSYNDYDSNHIISEVILKSLPQHGVLKLSENNVKSGQSIDFSDIEQGFFTFTPVKNYPSPALTGVDSFEFSIKNSNSQFTDNKTFSITVKDTADPPVISNDSAIATGGVPVLIDILSNDLDPLGPFSPPNDPNRYAIEIVNQPEHGRVTVEGKKLKYLPGNIEGVVDFTYKINNGEDSNVARVSVDVSYNKFLGSIIVDVMSDENDGDISPGNTSLREAINRVGKDGVTKVIFDESFNGKQITLTSPLVINKDIVIDGGDKVTLSGGEETTIFKITSGNVEIKNITLRDGLSQGGKGGGPSRFRSHGAGGGGAGLGGAIAIRNGNVLLDGVSFINNKAIGGNGGSANKMEHVLDEAPNSPLYKDMSGYGGSSVLGSGASRTVWGNRSSGKNGGLGGGGGGSINYDNGAKGGNGGFGGGGGGGDAGGFRRSSRGLGGLGGSFAGSGGNGAGGNNDTMNYLAGGGGGGAGLGGAVYIHDGILTARDCEFERNSAVGGVGGTGATKGTDGQGVGGAIFVQKDAIFNFRGGVTYGSNSAQTSDANYYIMDGAEYDTAPPVVAGTFTGEVTEENEGEESKVSGTITISDADADDNPQFEDIEIVDNYGLFSLANGNWSYSLDQIKVQGWSKGDLISNKIKLTATDGTEQIITININGSNDAPIGIAASVAVIEDGDAITGQLSSTDADVLVVFEENFDSLSLKPFESSSEKGGDGTDWTDELLFGWQMIKADDHGIKNGGTSVKEFDGWTFVDPVWWNQSAGGQNRSLFAKASGVIAVADPDEFDDLSDSKFNAALITPSIDVSKVEANSLILKFDSSWRKTGGVGSLIVQYDDGEEKILLTKNSNSPDAYSETIELPLENPKGSESLTIKWDRQGDNDYWWAIDNISVLGETKREYRVTKGVAGLEIDQDGSFTFDPSNSSYQSLAEGEVEELVAEWAVTDKDGASAQSTLTITVTGKNDSPVSVAASGETIEDGEIINGQLVVNDPDNNSTFTYALTDEVPGLVINEDGSYSFDPSVNAYQAIKSGEVKELIVNWKATDNNGAEASGKLTLKITGTNLVATPAVGNAMEDGVSTSGQLIATDDNEADLKYSLVSDIAGLTINRDGGWTFEATDEVYQSIALGKTRDVVANWKVEDESLGDSVTSTLTIAVTGANDNPVAVAATNEALVGSAPPSDGSTSFDLLWVSEEDNSQTMTMTMKFAKDTLGNPPETGFGNSVEGSVLTINYEGETTVHNDPEIIFLQIALLITRRN